MTAESLHNGRLDDKSDLRKAAGTEQQTKHRYSRILAAHRS